MSNHILLWLLLCGHFVGDFYMQPQSLVENKKKKTVYLLLHSIIYVFSVVFFALPYLHTKLIKPFIIIFVSHFAIDWVKIKVKDIKGSCNYFNRNAFCIDQLIHIAILIIIACIYANNNIIAFNIIGNKLVDFYNSCHIKITYDTLIRYMFVLLVIGKPTNILIKEINKKENIKKSCNNDNKIITKTDLSESVYQNAGKMIGILERIIIVIMIALNQYAAIGLIFTAKSITRYDKISKEPAFAEYYLVGTLLSLLVSILATLMIQVI